MLLVAGVLILVHTEHHVEDKGGLGQLSGPVRQILEHLRGVTSLVGGLRQMPVVVGQAWTSSYGWLNILRNIISHLTASISADTSGTKSGNTNFTFIYDKNKIGTVSTQMRHKTRYFISSWIHDLHHHHHGVPLDPLHLLLLEEALVSFFISLAIFIPTNAYTVLELSFLKAESQEDKKVLLLLTSLEGPIREMSKYWMDWQDMRNWNAVMFTFR